MRKKNTSQLPAPEAVPSLPPPAFSIAHWQSTPELQAQLSSALALPIMQMAFETLMRTILPRTPSGINPAPNVAPELMDKTLAYAFIDRAGFVRFHDRLHALARPKNEDPKRHEHFGSLLSDEE